MRRPQYKWLSSGKRNVARACGDIHRGIILPFPPERGVNIVGVKKMTRCFGGNRSWVYIQMEGEKKKKRNGTEGEEEKKKKNKNTLFVNWHYKTCRNTIMSKDIVNQYLCKILKEQYTFKKIPDWTLLRLGNRLCISRIVTKLLSIFNIWESKIYSRNLGIITFTEFTFKLLKKTVN